MLVLEDAEGVWWELREVSRRRSRHGYGLVKEVREAVVGTKAA